jgi:hypothetical protein
MPKTVMAPIIGRLRPFSAGDNCARNHPNQQRRKGKIPGGSEPGGEKSGNQTNKSAEQPQGCEERQECAVHRLTATRPSRCPAEHAWPSIAGSSATY